MILTKKVSNVSHNIAEVTFCSRLLAANHPPIGIYFISEDIFTLASYYCEDLRDFAFMPERKGLEQIDVAEVGGSSND